MILLQGRRYNRAKKAQGGTGANQYKQRDKNNTSAHTAYSLAKEHGVSPATIKRDGKFTAFMEEARNAEARLGELLRGDSTVPPASASNCLTDC